MEDLNKKIENTLSSIDGLQRAEAPAFFHTRTQVKLEKRLAFPQQETWLLVRRPAWVIAALVVMLVANVFMVSSFSSKTVLSSSHSAETNSLQGFASSYGLTTSTGY